MTLDEYRALLAKPGVADRNPELSNPHLHRRQAPIVEPDIGDVSLGKASLQKANRPRFRVTVHSVRKRLLDEDNGCEKFLVDQLRYAGLIANDNPALTTISTTQRRCEEGEPEHVEITIDLL